MDINPITRNTMEIEVGKTYKVRSSISPVTDIYFVKLSDGSTVTQRAASIMPISMFNCTVSPKNEAEVNRLKTQEPLIISSFKKHTFDLPAGMIRINMFSIKEWRSDEEKPDVIDTDWVTSNGFVETSRKSVWLPTRTGLELVEE